MTVRSALVLGAGSDIAVATLAELGTRGLDRVALAARDPRSAGDAARRVLPAAVEVFPIRWDATDLSGHPPMLDAAAQHLGPIDLVICAVGALGHHAGFGMPGDQIEAMIRANFSGPATALAAVAQRLVDQGHGTIVVLSSVAGVRARRSNFVYGSTKAGLDLFAQGLGDAVRDHGVRVIVVRPGFVHSKMTTGLDAAPFATTPEVVARRIVDALDNPRRDVVSVPSLLGPLFAVIRSLPRPLWRRVASNR